MGGKRTFLSCANLRDDAAFVPFAPAFYDLIATDANYLYAGKGYELICRRETQEAPSHVPRRCPSHCYQTTGNVCHHEVDRRLEVRKGAV